MIQKITLKGIIDAACPNCKTREIYYNKAESVGLVGALEWLRQVPNTNKDTVQMAEDFLATLN